MGPPRILSPNHAQAVLASSDAVPLPTAREVEPPLLERTKPKERVLPTLELAPPQNLRTLDVWQKIPNHELQTTLARISWAVLPERVQFDLDRVCPKNRNHRVSAQNWFDSLSVAQRTTLLVLRAKMHDDGIWHLVIHINYVGKDGSFSFMPSVSEQELQAELSAHGFGDWWMASQGVAWGMRNRLQGAELHLKGQADGVVNCHLDLDNPGDVEAGIARGAIAELPSALDHFYHDKIHWNSTHTPVRLVQALLGQGLNLFD